MSACVLPIALYSAAEFLAQARREGVRFELHGEKLSLLFPSRMPPARRSEIRFVADTFGNSLTDALRGNS